MKMKVMRNPPAFDSGYFLGTILKNLAKRYRFFKIYDCGFNPNVICLMYKAQFIFIISRILYFIFLIVVSSPTNIVDNQAMISLEDGGREEMKMRSSHLSLWICSRFAPVAITRNNPAPDSDPTSAGGRSPCRPAGEAA